MAVLFLAKIPPEYGLALKLKAIAEMKKSENAYFKIEQRRETIRL